jgi:hypothetical protein
LWERSIARDSQPKARARESQVANSDENSNNLNGETRDAPPSSPQSASDPPGERPETAQRTSGASPQKVQSAPDAFTDLQRVSEQFMQAFGFWNAPSREAAQQQSPSWHAMPGAEEYRRATEQFMKTFGWTSERAAELAHYSSRAMEAFVHSQEFRNAVARAQQAFGVSREQAEDLARHSAHSMSAFARSGGVLAQGFQDISRELKLSTEPGKALTIRHRSGPLAGQAQRIEQGAVERIVFGRDASRCDVVYPPEAAIVAGRHFALVHKPSGDWTVELFGRPFVAIDGEPADLGAPVHNGSVIELGRRGGPSFEVLIEGETCDMAVKTLPQEQVRGSRAAATEAQRAATGARRVGVAAIVLGLVAVGGAGALVYLLDRSDREFAHQLRGLRQQQERLAAESIPREFRDRLAKAAFYVIHRSASGRETWGGTAFPIGPHTLATAAHVAVVREQLEPGDKLLVRAPGPDGQTWELISHRLHPAYEPFQAFLREDPLMVETVQNENNPWGAQMVTSGNSYDVAWMQVAGPPLPLFLDIASREEILRLGAGDPLAFAGYPAENITGSEVQKLGPTPQVRMGSVIAMTDLFTLPAQPAYRRLLHHNLGTTIGTSGSPIIGSSGQLVAIHNRTNYITTQHGVRIPAVVAYAQRADMLADLLSGQSEAMVDNERAYWARQTAVMRRGADVIIPSIVEANKPVPEATPVVASHGRFALSAKERTRIQNEAQGDKGEKTVARRKQHTFKVQGGTNQLFLAYAQKATSITLYLSVKGGMVKKQDAERWYPAIAYEAPADGSVDIFVVGPDEDVTYTLTHYVWDIPKS